MAREIALIGNLGSRTTQRDFAAVQDALRGAGVRIVECHAVSRGRELSRRLRKVVREGAEIVAVAGGDGSMTRAAAELAHKRCTLGVLPLGTGNSFARSLGIDDVDEAVQTIAHGRVRKVDLGIVNGCYFANFATIGLPSEIAAGTPDKLKRISGVAAYVLTGIVRGLRSRHFGVKIRGGRIHFDGKVHEVVVASGRCFGTKPLIPEASPRSGDLVVFTTTADGAPEIARDFFALARGKHTQLEDAHWWTARRVRIKTSRPQKIAVDGKLIDKTPARVRIDPRALRVFVPRDFDDEF